MQYVLLVPAPTQSKIAWPGCAPGVCLLTAEFGVHQDWSDMDQETSLARQLGPILPIENHAVGSPETFPNHTRRIDLDARIAANKYA